MIINIKEITLNTIMYNHSNSFSRLDFSRSPTSFLLLFLQY